MTNLLKRELPSDWCSIQHGVRFSIIFRLAPHCPIIYVEFPSIFVQRCRNSFETTFAQASSKFRRLFDPEEPYLNAELWIPLFTAFKHRRWAPESRDTTFPRRSIKILRATPSVIDHSRSNRVVKARLGKSRIPTWIDEYLRRSLAKPSEASPRLGRFDGCWSYLPINRYKVHRSFQ